MKKGMFITGTSTGVGKTVITGGLAKALESMGIDVGVMKPLESGCRKKGGRLIPKDAIFLRNMASVEDDLNLINPYRFRSPLAPAVAAEIEGIEITVERIVEVYQILEDRHDLMLVEGIGGLLVPVKGVCRVYVLISDLIKTLGLPLLVVARADLGTINHTLLTVRYAETIGLEVLGVVFNNLKRNQGLAEKENRKVLPKLLDGVSFWEIPFIASLENHDMLLQHFRGLAKGLLHSMHHPALAKL